MKQDETPCYYIYELTRKERHRQVWLDAVQSMII